MVTLPLARPVRAAARLDVKIANAAGALNLTMAELMRQQRFLESFDLAPKDKCLKNNVLWNRGGREPPERHRKAARGACTRQTLSKPRYGQRRIHITINFLKYSPRTLRSCLNTNYREAA